jgi:6-phosphogluconolactonase
VDVETFADPAAVAHAAAARIRDEARIAIAARGQFTLAVSGGQTPWQMLRALADLPLDWARVHLFQVDERAAPDGDPDRNLTHIRESLLEHVPLPADRVHAMPVTAPDLAAAGRAYALELQRVAGVPAVLDLVHLGLGPDGHTASLVPDDPVLAETQADVGVTGPYQGHPRMTLTYPVLDRARGVLFVATGVQKVAMVQRLRAGDRTIPAGRVVNVRASLFIDAAAAGVSA